MRGSVAEAGNSCSDQTALKPELRSWTEETETAEDLQMCYSVVAGSVDSTGSLGVAVPIVIAEVVRAGD